MGEEDLFCKHSCIRETAQEPTGCMLTWRDQRAEDAVCIRNAVEDGQCQLCGVSQGLGVGWAPYRVRESLLQDDLLCPMRQLIGPERLCGRSWATGHLLCNMQRTEQGQNLGKEDRACNCCRHWLIAILHPQGEAS